MTGGFITLHRQILDWEWYSDSNTKDVFIHLLLTASFADTSLHGKTIRRGQVVTSLPSISTALKMSIQQVRTALKHLISTGEITDEACHGCRVITIVKYDDYQTLTGKSTGNQQATNRQRNRQSTDEPTGNQQHYNNINNNNNVNNKKESIGGNIPPTLDEVKTYIQENGFTVEPNRFFDYYESCGWVLNNGKKMKNWMATVRTWQGREKDGSRGQPVRSGTAHENDSGKNTSKYHDLPGVARV